MGKVKSILQDEKYCFMCATTMNLEEHHVIHGTSNRKNADKHGLTIWLCHEHHKYIHLHRDADLALIQIAQAKFEESHTREEFRAIFGKSWL